MKNYIYYIYNHKTPSVWLITTITTVALWDWAPSCTWTPFCHGCVKKKMFLSNLTTELSEHSWANCPLAFRAAVTWYITFPITGQNQIQVSTTYQTMRHCTDTILEIFWSRSLIFLHPPTILSLHLAVFHVSLDISLVQSLLEMLWCCVFFLQCSGARLFCCSTILCVHGSKGLATSIQDAALLRRVGVGSSACHSHSQGTRHSVALLLPFFCSRLFSPRLYFYAHECVCGGERTTAEAAALLPQCGSWELSSGHQAWWQEPLPSELPRWPQLYNLIWYAETQ